MSNRMKIKDRAKKKGNSVKLTPELLAQAQQTKERIENYQDRLCTKVTFIANVGVERLERSILNMIRYVEEEGLLGNRVLVKEVDNMLYAVRKFVTHLREHGKRYRLVTANWMQCYKKQYVSESRVMSNIQNLARWECQGEYDELRAKAAELAAIQETISHNISAEILLSASWIRMISGTYNAAEVEWNKRTGGELIKTDDFFVKLKSQFNALNSIGERANDALGKFCYDISNPLWKEYHTIEDKLWLKLVHLDNNEDFNDRVVAYNVTDWVDFYLGHALLETQQTGNAPKAVMRELESSFPEISQSVKRMLLLVSKKVEQTDDPYDFIDYLAEHDWKAYKALHEATLNKVKLNITSSWKQKETK